MPNANADRDMAPVGLARESGARTGSHQQGAEQGGADNQAAFFHRGPPSYTGDTVPLISEGFIPRSLLRRSLFNACCAPGLTLFIVSALINIVGPVLTGQDGLNSGRR